MLNAIDPLRSYLFLPIMSGNSSPLTIGAGTYGYVTASVPTSAMTSIPSLLTPSPSPSSPITATKHFAMKGTPTLDEIENWMKEATVRAILGNETQICPTLAIDYNSLSITMERFDCDLAVYCDRLASRKRLMSLPKVLLAQRLEDFLLHTVLPSVCRQLAALHRRGIMHMDIKPTNILMRRRRNKSPSSKYDIALTDFGASLIRQGKAQTNLTTSGFYPRGVEKRNLDYRYDMYGLGKSLLVCMQLAGLGEKYFRTQFLNTISALTSNYDAIPGPESYCSGVSELTELIAPVPRLLTEQGTKVTLAGLLYALLAPRNYSHIIKTCNSLSLLLRGASVLDVLRCFALEANENPIENIHIKAFLETYTKVLQDPESLQLIRSFLQSLVV